jgi:hypothetical protein
VVSGCEIATTDLLRRLQGKYEGLGIFAVLRGNSQEEGDGEKQNS